MLGRTLRLYLADGHPAGLVVAEILNWTGKVLSFPRGLLPQVLKSRDEIGKTGVYFLIGSDPENPFSSLVYIGESDDVKQRLIWHDKDESKAFFDQVVLVVSKDENLTKGHVRFLESRLIEITRQNGQAKLKNGNLGQPVTLPESDRADMEYFLQQIRVVLPVLGLSFLQELPRRPTSREMDENQSEAITRQGVVTLDEDSPTFELTFMNGLVRAEAYEAEGQFILKCGSLMRNPEQATPSASRSYFQRIEQAREQGLIVPVEGQQELYRLTQDIPFKSPSGAADFVCGTSISGPWYWKVQESGQSYGEWRAGKLEESSNEAIPQASSLLS